MGVRVEKRFWFYLMAELVLVRSICCFHWAAPGKTFSHQLVQLGLGDTMPFIRVIWHQPPPYLCWVWQIQFLLFCILLHYFRWLNACNSWSNLGVFCVFNIMIIGWNNLTCTKLVSTIKMVKTKLFGRPTSKISHKTSLAEENQFVERFRTPDPGPESRNGHKQSGGHKHSDEKMDKRRQVDKAKKLSEKTNSLKRRKKHETAKTMAQKIPRDFVKDAVFNSNVNKNAPAKGEYSTNRYFYLSFTNKVKSF